MIIKGTTIRFTLILCLINYREIGRAVNCTNASSLKACLIEKRVEDLIAAQGKVVRAPLLAQFAVVVDGHFLFGKSHQLRNR